GAPTLRSVLDVVLDPGRDYELQTRNGAPDPVTTRGEGDTIVHHFEISNLARRVPEELRPSLTETEPLVRITTYRDWDQFASWWAALIRKQTEVTDAMRSKVAELTAGLGTEREKIDAIYRFVTTDIQYKAWEFGVHGYQPYSTAVIFERRHGDCKDKALLMNTLLGEAGIEAHPVLIFADPRRSEDDLSLAMVQHFNHCISYLPATDARPGMFLDGTAVYHPSNTLPDMDQGARVLVVHDEGGEIRDVPWTSAGENLDERTFDVKLDADGSALVHMVHEPRRSHAVAVRESLGNEPAKRREVLERELSALFGSIEIVSVATSGLADLSAPVRVEVEFRCKELATRQGGDLVLEPGFADDFLSAVTSKKEREFALILGPPWSTRQRVVYRLPDDFGPIGVPEPSQLDPRFGSFSSRWTRRADGSLEVERELSLETNRIEPQEYPAFREFATDVGQADRRTVIVRRKS
ncbi:MAG: hypothetical protein KDB80_17930, partial [Planctomycetes bacterium]|nr:hypothetical protein [Planctomycetota bacterium]